MDYLEILETYHDDMLKTLEELVAIPSVTGDPVKTADGEVLPCGRAAADALKYMLDKGTEMGFTAFNADNYGGHLEFAGCDGDSVPETFGVVGHLDVVPAGEGWKHNPFEMLNEEGYLYGRGVSDDKGPMVASLYAMKAIKEAGIVPKKNIRMIFGLDEEVGIMGIGKYLEIAGQPDMGFTPDADFPLVNGEKGILVFELAQKLTRSSNKDGMRLTKLEAGTASNAVPGSAKAVITADDKCYTMIKDRLAQFTAETEYDVKAKKQGTSLVLEATGIAAHGAHPELGLNAVSILMDFLGRLQFSNEEINDYIAFYNEHIAFNLHGEGMNCELQDEPSGKLIWNVGLATINEDLASITINVRYPVTCNSDQVFDGVNMTLSRNKIGVVKLDDIKPIYMDVDTPMVKKLLTAYREETGNEDAEPFVIGGGTYAKAVNNTLAFGALFPDEEDTMHQVGEKMKLESFFKMARVYAKALYLNCCE